MRAFLRTSYFSICKGCYIMKKKLIGVLLAAVLLISALPVQAQSTEYTDVSPSEWFYEAVNYVSTNSVMTGVADKTFAPRDNLTRGMAVTILSRTYGADTSAFKDAPFTDVDMKKILRRACCMGKSKTGLSTV